ncbi:hypothetical protein [Nitrosospira briensis]|uniref:hypothetical protein n=1 Tax=Nitrosospira briensis TaxID=35799 RepID=UPI00046A494A|nr:hypothetical protein [Nitrosospira briensis]
MQRQHKLINPDNPFAAWAIMIIALILFFSLLSWIRDREMDPENLIRCPRPGPGQQLIGRGHMETDGQPGELMCTYSTAPIGQQVTLASSKL